MSLKMMAGERRMYQMPLVVGENFKQDNKLVYCTMLKAACVKSDARTWIQDHNSQDIQW